MMRREKEMIRSVGGRNNRNHTISTGSSGDHNNKASTVLTLEP
jgi:hypothetical protein